jgi:hypothetical protein
MPENCELDMATCSGLIIMNHVLMLLLSGKIGWWKFCWLGGQEAEPVRAWTASRTVVNIAIVWAAISEQCWRMCDAMKGMRVNGE